MTVDARFTQHWIGIGGMEQIAWMTLWMRRDRHDPPLDETATDIAAGLLAKGLSLPTTSETAGFVIDELERRITAFERGERV